MEFVYGDIYLRPGLSLHDREMVAVATLVALGRSSQVPQHLRGALKVGVTPDELREVILQTAAIAGFPPAMNAMSTLKTILAEQGNYVRSPVSGRCSPSASHASPGPARR